MRTEAAILPQFNDLQENISAEAAVQNLAYGKGPWRSLAKTFGQNWDAMPMCSILAEAVISTKFHG